jgi:hypothetical protein
MTFSWLVPLAVGAIALVCALFWIVRKARTPASDRERRRRLRINVLGRLGDGMLTDAQGDLVYYSYSVSGVPYSTAQDIGTLRALVPSDAALIIGPVALKYLPRDPGNSIVVCETWSGLRIKPKTADDPVDSSAIRPEELPLATRSTGGVSSSTPELPQTPSAERHAL